MHHPVYKPPFLKLTDVQTPTRKSLALQAKTGATSVAAHTHLCERMVLTAILTEEAEPGRSAVLLDVNPLQPEHMFAPPHAQLYRIMMDMWLEDRVINLDTVRLEVVKKGMVEDELQAGYLVEDLLNTSPVPTTPIRQIAHEIIDCWKLRSLESKMLEVLPCLEWGASPEELIHYMGQRFEEIAAVGADEREATLLGDRIRERFEDIRDNAEVPATLPSGFPSLDEKIGGLLPNDLWVIAGTSGSGKSSLADRIAIAVAKEGAGVLYLHWEMSSKMVTSRMLCGESRVPFKHFVTRQILKSEFPALLAGAEMLTKVPLHVMNMAGSSAHDIALKLAERKAEGEEIKLVIIDYATIVAPSDPRMTRTAALHELMLECMRLNEKENVAIILLSQLNAIEVLKGAKGEDKGYRVRGEHAAYGQCVRQSANTMLIIEPALERQDFQDVNIIVDKCRTSAPGAKIPLRWEGPYCRYSDEESWSNAGQPHLHMVQP